ncbi:hypothetical protein [Bradyrhizobium sp. USDA 4473]
MTKLSIIPRDHHPRLARTPGRFAAERLQPDAARPHEVSAVDRLTMEPIQFSSAGAEHIDPDLPASKDL